MVKTDMYLIKDSSSEYTNHPQINVVKDRIAPLKMTGKQNQAFQSRKDTSDPPTHEKC